ncbi:family 20 glycosylhydrolase [Enterococcus sp. LJL98]
MKFQISKEQQEVLNLFKKKKLGTCIFDDKINLVSEKITSENQIVSVRIENGTVTIQYTADVLFYRGLFTLYPRLLESGQEQIKEETTIQEVAVSLDFSRNAVMKTEKIEEFLMYLAAVGVNTLYLYTEDTYEVKEESYFGYLRGGYSADEIRKIVEYATHMGIEVVPAIQTLAHLTQFLKWPSTFEMKEDAHTLLIDEERSYQTIKRMIDSCKEMYQSNRIHLGMDEAYQAGLVRYLDIHGYTPRVELILKHLKRVIQLTEDVGLKPMIWSDFVYKVLDQTKTGRLYNPDAQMDPSYIQEYPKHLTYVHWDYGCEDIEQYKRVMRNHLSFCNKENYMLATGAHIFGKIAPNHGKSINTMIAGIKACRDLGLGRTMLTTWGDDGQETEHLHALISMYYYCEAIYGSTITSSQIRRSLDFLIGEGTYTFLYELTYFDEVFGMLKNNPMMGNISKSILWQDPLLGIYDAHIYLYEEKFHHTLGNYYEKLAKKIEAMPLENIGIINRVQERYLCLAQVLALKATLGVDLQQAYLTKDVFELKKIQTIRIEKLIEKYTQLQTLHEEIWDYYYKANGWEVLERRYAASISRLKTTSRKIQRYLDFGVGLEELQEKKQLFCQVSHPVDFSGFNYDDTASSGYH